MINSFTFSRASFGFLCNGFLFVQSNFHCNYFEWVNESESTFEGKESEFESSGGKIVEEDKGCCLEKDKVIMDLIKKNEKLKRKLQQEKKIGNFLQLLFVVVGGNCCFDCYGVVEG